MSNIIEERTEKLENNKTIRNSDGRLWIRHKWIQKNHLNIKGIQTSTKDLKIKI